MAIIVGVRSVFPRLQALGPWAMGASGAAQGVAYGVGSAFVVRTMLQTGAARWRLDRGFWGYVAIIATLAALQTAAPAAASRLMSAPGGSIVAQATPLAILIRLAVILAVFWLGARIVLWTIGVLIGDRRLGFAFAWRAMGGAVFAYLLAYALAVGPLYVADTVAATWFYRSGVLPALGLVGAAYTAIGFVTAGLHVEAYRQRLGPSEADLAEVFG
jgi:hypothetical protein